MLVLPPVWPWLVLLFVGLVSWARFVVCFEVGRSVGWSLGLFVGWLVGWLVDLDV